MAASATRPSTQPSSPRRETRSDHEVLLNEKLTTELRPTLFLAQLSNLLAGNISIVHKVTGSSRTFMGEEGAGVSAIETAAARIRSGQSSHMLVGGAFATEHPDMILGYELGGYLHRGPHASVWDRTGSPGGGVVSGSGSAFLVLESREHARRAARASMPNSSRSSPAARGAAATALEAALGRHDGGSPAPATANCLSSPARPAPTAPVPANGPPMRAAATSPHAPFRR